MPRAKLTPRVLVLADDLTGLAEVACQASGSRLSGTFIPLFEGEATARLAANADTDLLFLNLGCRALPPEQAARRVNEALQIIDWGKRLPRVYFKIDSTARGPIGAMLGAARTALKLTGNDGRVPLCLANPFTGRFVLGGNLSINGVPVHLTSFGIDRLHPIATDAVAELLGPTAANLEILDATKQPEISAHADAHAGAQLAAGAAPFALELLTRWLPQDWLTSRPESTEPVIEQTAFDRLLVVIGSAHPANKQIMDECVAAGGAIIDSGKGSTNVQGKLPLVVIEREGEATAHGHMQRLIATAAWQIERHAPRTILITGGETALHLFQHLGVRQLQTCGMRPPFCVLEQPARGDTPRRQFWVKPGGYKLNHQLGLLLWGPAAG